MVESSGLVWYSDGSGLIWVWIGWSGPMPDLSGCLVDGLICRSI